MSAVADIEHDDCVLSVIDLVEHAPVPSEPCAVDAGEFIDKSLADTLRVLQERTRDELDCCFSNVRW